MRPPDWKLTAAAGLAVGLTISGLSLARPARVELVVQAIELRAGAVQPDAPSTLSPGGPSASEPAEPAIGSGPPASSTPVEPAPVRTPTVVPPLVVWEQATPKPGRADQDDDDAADAAAEAAEIAREKAEKAAEAAEEAAEEARDAAEATDEPGSD
jgi:hypothetical protein